MSASLQEKSMSYTSGTAMDQRGLRDVERWRDKIEVRLDNRQVFFLFFGSALVACLLFVLGVIVGKRLESRGRAVAPEVEDPLALLDKVASTPRTTQTPAVTFPQALFGKNAAGSAKKVEPKLVAPVPAENKAEAKAAEPAAAPAPAKPINGKTLAKVDQPTEASKPAEKPVPAASKPAASKPVPVASKPVPAPTETAKPTAPSKPAIVAAAPAAKGEDAAPKGPVPVVGAATDSAKGKGRYTLQLSSFQERGEAEAFAAKVGAEKTFITVSEIPGKGTWYRVRVGDFGSAKDALAGKLAFEKKHSVIAYVTQR
jgi:DedD protein